MGLGTPAAEVVAGSARGPGVRLRELASAAEALRGAEVLRAVWGGAETVVPANLIRAVQQTGGYAFGAYDHDGVLLAVSVGLLATEGLHSHITGVLPAGQRRGLGLLLKQHQRDWALERGMTTITWTCDPLVRRNVAFNLHALGATVEDYLPDHYGPMADGVNQGDESDRFAVRWDLLSDRAVAAAGGRLPWCESRAPLVVSDAGTPVVAESQDPDRRIQLPGDIEAIRRTDPPAAQAWRRAVRDAVLGGYGEGAVITGLTAEGALVMAVSS